MTTIKPVVIGIADKQPAALVIAAQAARHARVPLRVVHSAGLPAQATEFYLEASVFEDIRKAGQLILDDARAFLSEEAPDVVAEYVLTTAPAVAALMVEARAARLLVVGADDVPWYDRLLRSAVAGHLAGHAACPVVVVPEGSYPLTTTGGVVLTIDGDTSAAGPVRFAFEQADSTGSELDVLHATPPATLAADAEGIRANVSAVMAGWRDRYPDVRVRLSFTVGDPGEACLRATEDAALLVVGRPHGRTTPFALARPLAMQVLRGAGCPVAVVPSDYVGV